MKTLILIFSLLFVNTSYADHIDSITIINNGKPGGSFNARTQLYKQGLEDKGYHVDYLDVGKISQAVKMFKESIDPTIMVYANNQVFKQDLFHTDQNFVLLEFCKSNTLLILYFNNNFFKLYKNNKFQRGNLLSIMTPSI